MEPFTKYTMFQALRPHFKNLINFYFIYTNDPRSGKDLIKYNFCRVCVWTAVIVYNMQFLICVIQSRHNTDAIVDTLFVFLTTFIAVVKHLAFNVRLERIMRLFSITEEDLFSPKNDGHVKILDMNEKAMGRLLRFYLRMVFGACALQAVYPIFNKQLGQQVKLNAYFPFETETSPVFELATVYLAGMLTLQAYVNLLCDCSIIAFYAQTMVQIRLLRYTLEHLVDSNDIVQQRNQGYQSDKRNEFNHEPDMTIVNVDKNRIKEKVVQCVNHYQQIVWFIREVESVTWEAMTCQYLLTAWIICMTVYKIVGVSITSTEFWTVTSYLICMLFQLFIYSYYGTQVEVESQLVCQSVYVGDWLALSPFIRRQLLIFMTRASRPIKPTAAKIVSISLQSYIAVLRASYTLFTVLDKK